MAGPYRDLDVLTQACPRCAFQLGLASENGMRECAGCGGVFAPHDAFDALKAEADADAARAPSVAPSRSSPRHRHDPLQGADAEVHYLKCPECGATMNRTNFGHRSGFIVDICKMHGIWFDAGELAGIVDFIACGGLRR